MLPNMRAGLLLHEYHQDIWEESPDQRNPIKQVEDASFPIEWVACPVLECISIVTKISLHSLPELSFCVRLPDLF